MLMKVLGLILLFSLSSYMFKRNFKREWLEYTHKKKIRIKRIKGGLESKP